MERVELILVEFANDPSANHRQCCRGASEVDPAPDGGEFLRSTTVVTMKTSFDLGADTANENLGEQIMDGIEVLTGESILTVLVYVSERVRHHYVHIPDDDGPVFHSIAALSAIAHWSALEGSSNQYSSSRGTSSSSTTDCSQPASSSSSDSTPEGIDK